MTLPLSVTPPADISPVAADAQTREADMTTRQRSRNDIESTELRDFSRTVADIEWLLVILVLLYHVFQDRNEDNTVAIYLGLKVTATVSIGIACYPNHGGDLDSVLEKADGKNRTTMFPA